MYRTILCSQEKYVQYYFPREAYSIMFPREGYNIMFPREVYNIMFLIEVFTVLILLPREGYTKHVLALSPKGMLPKCTLCTWPYSQGWCTYFDWPMIVFERWSCTQGRLSWSMTTLHRKVYTKHNKAPMVGTYEHYLVPKEWFLWSIITQLRLTWSMPIAHVPREGQCSCCALFLPWKSEIFSYTKLCWSCF